MAHYTRMTLAVTICLVAMSGAHGATVELAESAQIAGDHIELGAVAIIGGSDEEVALLAGLDLGPAPLPGQSRILSLGYLKMRLRRWGVNAGEITFAGAPQVRVSKSAAVVAVATHDTGTARQTGVTQTPAPVVVKRGSMVRLRVTCGAVSVMAGATTLEDAAVGAVVKMRVAQTRQTVWAVLASQTEANLNQ